MKDNLYAVIMAGGKGERFWPLSTSKRPKQVLSLVGGRPMLAQAVERLAGFIPPERVIVITNASLVDVSREAAPELPPENIIGEPFGRDTAAACALAAAIVKARCPQGAFCILTADHVMKNIPLFQQTLEEGFNQAESEDSLVTIGIKPTFASTGLATLNAEKLLKMMVRLFFTRHCVLLKSRPRRLPAAMLIRGAISGTRECLFGRRMSFSTRLKNISHH